MTRKLGRVASRQDPRTLRLARYIDTKLLPAAPSARDWSHPAVAPSWRMFMNDQIGCCTCASIGHLWTAQAANSGKPFAIDDSDILGTYEAAGGYDPERPETDRGAQMLDVLVRLRDVGMAAQKVGAFASVSPTNRAHVEAAINLFGGVYVGLELPRSAMDQTVWDVAPPGKYDASYDRNSWGGHAVAMLGYDRTHVTFVTWGQIKIATVEWFLTYCDEAWCLVDDLWVTETSLAPSGFNIEMLRSDLALINAEH